MEDYFWILILGAFWLFEVAGKAIKKKGQTENTELDAPRPDPRRSSRDLSREVDASARRAEDALQRLEARQGEVVPVQVSAPAAVDRRAEKIRRRREAFEAIASMLVVPPESEAASPVPLVQAVAAPVPDKPAVRPPSQMVAGPPAARTAPPAAAGRPTGHGIAGLSGLSEIQRAIVLSEILGPPVSLSKRSAFHLGSG